eukprot:3117626-Prymnesium_polylepis.1
MLLALSAGEHDVTRNGEYCVGNDAKALPRLPNAPARKHGVWEHCREDTGGRLASPETAVEESAEEDALG